MKWLAPLFAFALASCGEVKTGGFETSDLQARVHRADGSPVASARVWLVRSRGNSAPAIVLDSAWTDVSGEVRFPAPEDGQNGLGLDVQKSDSLALGIGAFESATSAFLRLAAAHKLSIASDSQGTPRCYVPGSHFVSSPSAGGEIAQILLPQGTWNLAVVRGTASPILSPISVTKDSVVVVRAPADSDTASKPPIHATGPDISLDSFQIDGQVFSKDPSFSPEWYVRIDTISGSSRERTHRYTETSDSFSIESKSVRFLELASYLDGVYLSELKSADLPDSGLLAIRLRFTKSFDADSGRNLLFQLVDSGYNGLSLSLDPRMRPSPDSLQVASWGDFQASDTGMQTAEQKLTQTVWYFRWTPTFMQIANDAGMVGAAIAFTRMQGPPFLRIRLQTFLNGPPAKVHLISTRLYRPR
ncbi:MAG TPA: hypothetical protein PKO15_00965 [Fibrobacteria bacterium]|nr:hypothetical protein [Fibrobacteria bacterium]HOX52030.1 hypothetical protein [Fibrobacteria bacterium]